MTWSFLAGSPDDSAGAVYDVTVPGAWEELVEFSADGDRRRPLERIVAIARQPSVCHRWHLFTDEVPADLSRLRPEAYRGYVVLRPLPRRSGAPR